LILNVTFVQGHSELESHKLIYSYVIIAKWTAFEH